MPTTATIDSAGAGLTIGGVTLYIVDTLKIIPVNDILTGVSILLGIVWMIFKTKNEMLTFKLKKRKLDEID